eukprot:6601810-Pyramimonas_sp.AAC.1
MGGGGGGVGGRGSQTDERRIHENLPVAPGTAAGPSPSRAAEGVGRLFDQFGGGDGGGRIHPP